MSEKINVDIQGVQLTMLIPLRGRSIMSKRFPTLYKNESDIKICEKLNFDFTMMDSALGEYGNLCYIARALAVEKVIRQFIQRYPKATIVNIGSGLDTTFTRMDNGMISWYDLDLPDAMSFRNKIIQKSENSHCIPKSVFDYSWFDDIQYDEKNGLLLIAAGVFHFLPEDELKKLFIAITEQFSSAELFFDINSAMGNTYSNQSMKESGNKGAKLLFAVDDPKVLEKWSDNIKLVECLPYFKDIPRFDELEDKTKQYMEMADAQGMCKFISLQIGKR